MPLLQASPLGTAVPASCWLPHTLQGARVKKSVLQAGNSLAIGGKMQCTPRGDPRLSEITGLQRGLCSLAACWSGNGVLPQHNQRLAFAGGVSSGLLSASWRWCTQCCQALSVLFRNVGFHLEPVLPVLGWQKKSMLSIWPSQSSWEEQSMVPGSPVYWEICLPMQEKGSCRCGGGVTQAT